jgi:acetaldehyde dehydrogenase (acetylating)
LSVKKKLKIAILGTGNIGTDLLIKSIRSDLLECTLFAGRNHASPGMQKARNLGINVSSDGINSIIENPTICDLVFDCTSAAAHKVHSEILFGLNIAVINLTPEKVGKFCVPVINGAECFDPNVPNLNMVTCGGQVSIPIAYAISQVHKEIDYLEVASTIASRSAGPATRENLDEYIQTTQNALINFSGAKRAKAILILNPAIPPVDMQTTIYARVRNPKIELIRKSVSKVVSQINQYVPGYKIIVPPVVEHDRIITTVKVIGVGDYLPSYAGNLDIINCAAISIAEQLTVRN